jgi:hypothetical protein
VTEAQTQDAIRLALGARDDVLIFRNNCGVAEHWSGTRLTRVVYGLAPGSADLVGVLAPSGRWIALEVKSETGRVDPAQSKWLALVRRFGGFACVVRSTRPSPPSSARSEAPMSRSTGIERDIAQALLATFRPRLDVYARRIDSAKEAEDLNSWCRGRGAPARWREGDWKPVRRFNRESQVSEPVPLDLDAVADHVAGRATIGFYPLRVDGTANSVSVDFDAHRGEREVEGDPFADLDALSSACLRRGVRFLANVSRGGAGAWLHILLPDGTPARRGRGIVAALVRDAGLRHVDDGGSFDAIFPKQDDLRTATTANPGNLFCAPVCGRWLRATSAGTHFLNTNPLDLDAQLRALTEY